MKKVLMGLFNILMNLIVSLIALPFAALVIFLFVPTILFSLLSKMVKNTFDSTLAAVLLSPLVLVGSALVAGLLGGLIFAVGVLATPFDAINQGIKDAMDGKFSDPLARRQKIFEDGQAMLAGLQVPVAATATPEQSSVISRVLDGQAPSQNQRQIYLNPPLSSPGLFQRNASVPRANAANHYDEPDAYMNNRRLS